MRVVIGGATGSIGSSLVGALLAADHTPVGVARRVPSGRAAPGVRWVSADLARSRGRRRLLREVRGADAYVHLAWPLQPMRRPRYLHRAGPEAMLACVLGALDAGVPHVVHVSSVAAYRPAAGQGLVDETWPLGGVPTSRYARHKAEGERRLADELGARAAQGRVAVLRPCLVGQEKAGSLMLRSGAPAIVPNALVSSLPVVPVVDGFALQMVHADDVAAAIVAAVERRASGPFNLAGDGLATAHDMAAALGARPLRVPAGTLRAFFTLAWHAHLSPLDPGWIDMADRAPWMSSARARQELGWRPRHTATDVLQELVAGMASGASAATPPLRGRSVRGGLLTALRRGTVARRPRV